MNIRQIIQEEYIEVHLQPIMSTHNPRFLGFESLIRGVNNNGGTIPPNMLFKQAIREGLVLDLDKLCIKKGLIEAGKLIDEKSDAIIFLNIDASVIEHYIHTTYILDLVDQLQIRPQNIVLEVNELPVESLNTMKEFSRLYREAGFLIAIDDIGAGASNLDRIPMIMPDIMKIDKELVRDIDKSFYKSQVVSMIIQLATNLGALVVVEGIEDIKELKVISENGAHLIQGYYLGRPQKLKHLLLEDIEERVEDIINQLHHESVKKANDQLKLKVWMNDICDELIEEIRSEHIEDYPERIIHHLKRLDSDNTIESIYVINQLGDMVTPTIFNKSIFTKLNTNLFQACNQGESVRLEVYYTKIIHEKHEYWVSKEYISRATGNKCVTLTKSFIGTDGLQYIVCMDFHKKNMDRSLLYR